MWGTSFRRRLGIAVAAFALLALSAPAATADSPRRDILFPSDRDAVTPDIDIYAMKTDGTDIIRLTDTDGAWNNAPDWSPNGKRVVLQRCDTPITFDFFNWRCDIWVMNADGTGEVNVTDTPGEQEWFPKWSPNGKQVVFSRGTLGTGVHDIYVMDADGSDLTNITNTPAVFESVADWSPNGKEILYSALGDVHVHNLEDGTSTNLTNSPLTGEGGAVWSPNGQRIAFTSGGLFSNTGDIAVMDADGGNVVHLTDTGLDFVPRWSRDGQEIYFLSNRDLVPPANCLTPNFVTLIPLVAFCTQLYVMDADGAGESPVLIEGDASIHTFAVR